MWLQLPVAEEWCRAGATTVELPIHRQGISAHHTVDGAWRRLLSVSGDEHLRNSDVECDVPPTCCVGLAWRWCRCWGEARSDWGPAIHVAVQAEQVRTSTDVLLERCWRRRQQVTDVDRYWQACTDRWTRWVTNTCQLLWDLLFTLTFVGVKRSSTSVSLSVCVMKLKWLNSTVTKLAIGISITSPRLPINIRSKGQRSGSQVTKCKKFWRWLSGQRELCTLSSVVCYNYSWHAQNLHPIQLVDLHIIYWLEKTRHTDIGWSAYCLALKNVLNSYRCTMLSVWRRRRNIVLVFGEILCRSDGSLEYSLWSSMLIIVIIIIIHL